MCISKMANTLRKNRGNIYTPTGIVRMMLDYGGYIVSDYIRRKHVIDNSCGDGRFLTEIARRYIEACKSSAVIPTDDEIRVELETYIHGVDIECSECEKCVANLNAVANEYGLGPVRWDVQCANSLTISDFDGKMDFVFGNPPYVRIHNMKEGSGSEDYDLFRGFKFSGKGMSDLYLAFFEIGFRMRNENGILCYITPSGWFTSLSGENLRKYVRDTMELSRVIDFGNEPVFEGVSTYVAVTVFDRRPHGCIQYDRFESCDEYLRSVACVPYEDAFIDGKLYFGTRSELDLVRSVSSIRGGKVTVKNGYATLADRVFINNLPPLSMYVIDVLKASTGEWKKCLFPYDADMNPVSMDTIRDTASDVYDYIMENESVLKSRSYDETSEGYWHLLGRSQGLNDTCKKKIAVNTMLRNESDIRLEEVPGGKGIYGGMYILGDVSISDVERALKDDKFVGYVKTLRKYKSGGYYTFSTKDLGRYLNYALSTDLRQ